MWTWKMINKMKISYLLFVHCIEFYFMKRIKSSINFIVEKKRLIFLIDFTVCILYWNLWHWHWHCTGRIFFYIQQRDGCWRFYDVDVNFGSLRSIKAKWIENSASVMLVWCCRLSLMKAYFCSHNVSDCISEKVMLMLQFQQKCIPPFFLHELVERHLVSSLSSK